MFSRWKWSTQYEKVGSHEDSRRVPEKLPLRQTNPIRTPTQCFAYPISFLCGVSLTIVALALWTAIHSPSSFETGFHTEIDVLHPVVEVVPTKFTGTLKYKGDHLYIDLGPDGVQYFGKPSPQIDEAWATLLNGIGNEDPFPGDIIGPDVLHTLHCLNAVRKLLDSTYYYKRPLEAHNRARRIHIDHCLNHIRQIIQCHMDITPVHTLYFKEMNTEVGNFDQVHMCRDFSQLQRFMIKNENVTLPASEDKKEEGGGKKAHREGYPENEESWLPWDTTWNEFE
ncbi:hypothetical protein DM02DRAFT_667451 [Periconia macrospinosa]|uniref:Tat pathway signal sequence n=1 Tax=Periconia macrospinosa TaxID=97972 RepID=A0A2V1E909_9PLEO|nr:hypothetical protein DM02DRAFT_667451 [Periconia macrospinosa]